MLTTIWMPDRNGVPQDTSTMVVIPIVPLKRSGGGLWLTSIRPIEQGEELLIDYDFDLGEEFEPCRCGHPRCRGLMLRKKDWPNCGE